jgi:pantoate--beta-alanine ligase
MPVVIESARELFERCEAERRAGRRVGFVPTMGALHDGHVSLMAAARARGADFLITSIFVNPLQFGPSEDFSRYPRTFEDDCARCAEQGVGIIYAPRPEAMYPPGFVTHVEVAELTEAFEGTFRPTHFRGVTTVVTKLLLAVGPCMAVFGRKDYQQWRVIERLVRDLDVPVEVVGEPIVREPDGLALSSRNRYLSAADRARALGIVRGLRASWDAHAAFERAAPKLEELARAAIEPVFDRIDYVACADPETLQKVQEVGARAVLLVAAHLGSTRLIDNVELGSDPRP